MASPARVLSVNVGPVRDVEWRGEAVATAIWKTPVAGRVALRGVNLAGDDQADRTVHGGPDKAVYAYAREDYDYWRTREGLDVAPALFGENLTVEGIDLSSASSANGGASGPRVLEVAQIRAALLQARHPPRRPALPAAIPARGRMGAYLRIVQEGDVGAGDAIEVVSRPTHGVSLATMLEALDDDDQARRLPRAGYLPKFWQRVAERT